MIRIALTAAALLVTTPTIAQTQQERLQTRYERALAAGYKALFLCGALAHASEARVPRSVESIETHELAGIQPPLDALVGEMREEIVWQENGPLHYVAVDWSDDMQPRLALNRDTKGCSLAPIGMAKPDLLVPAQVKPESDYIFPTAVARASGSKLYNPVGGAFVEQYGSGARTTAVIVTRSGSEVAAMTAPDFTLATPQRTWSVAKSIATTLVGAAVYRGEADVEASAGLGVAESDPRRSITVDHLLRMASGRYSDTPGNQTDPLYFGGSTVEETALHWPLIEKPGTSFRYANNDTLAAVRAIKGSFGEHPPAEFFETVGMNHTVAETDWQGDYILSSQVWSTAEDLAKLGQLYLNDGRLPDGTRILPEGWVEYVSTPSGPQPPGEMGYGAGFWLINKSEGVPHDTIAASGNRGQYVVIVPSRDVVIVRRGEDPVGARFDIIAFTRDVLAALGG